MRLGFPQCPDAAFLPVKILASAEEFQTGNFARVDVPRMPPSASEERVSPNLTYRAMHRDSAILFWRLPSLCYANARSAASGKTDEPLPIVRSRYAARGLLNRL